MSQLAIADKHYLNEDLIRISLEQNKLAQRIGIMSLERTLWFGCLHGIPFLGLCQKQWWALIFWCQTQCYCLGKCQNIPFHLILIWFSKVKVYSYLIPFADQYSSPPKITWWLLATTTTTTTILNEICKSKGEEKYVNWDLLKKFLHITQFVSSSTELFPSDHTVWPNRSNFCNPHFEAVRTQILRTSSSAS